MRDLLAVISILTQVLVIGAVLLAVLASLAQRQRLIAVLRALGASRRYVFATVWLSVALMLTAGSLLGLVLGYAAAFGLSRVFASQTAIALPVALSGPGVHCWSWRSSSSAWRWRPSLPRWAIAARSRRGCA